MNIAVNPYRKVVAKPAGVIPGLTKLPGQSNPFTNRTGEINASSQADLLVQIGEYIKASSPVSPVSMRASADEKAQIAADRRQTLITAFNDPAEAKILGEAIAAEIYETTSREGFARRVLQYREIGQGETNWVTVKEKNVVAYMATSASTVNAVEIRERRYIPDEIHINGYILIDTKELAQATGDLLEEKYEEGLEAIMVQEDRLWKRMADRACGVRNTIQNFSTFTPSVFSRMIDQIARWGIPPTTCLFNSVLWQDVIANGEFTGVLDPVTQWELLQQGFLGTMYGITMVTDFFRQPNMKVLETGEIYIVGSPINHGVFTMRGAMMAQPIDRFSDAEAKKGWFIDQICSMVVGNAMSITRGRKI